MGLFQAATGIAATPPKILDADAISLPREILRSFPGAVLLMERNGRVENLDNGSVLATGLGAEASWPDLKSRAAAAIERSAASVEILTVRGDTPVEATFLPLGDGARALVLLRPLEFANALHRSLVESRQRYKNFVEAICDFCWETDTEGNFSFVSLEGALGWSPREMVGRPVGDFLVMPEGEGPLPEVFQARSFLQNDDIWFRAADGSTECLSVSAAPLRNADGSWCGSRGLCRRVTEERRRDRETAQTRLHGQLSNRLASATEEETDPKAALMQAVSTVGLAICATGGAVLRQSEAGDLIEIARWGEGFSDEIGAQALALIGEGLPIDDLCGDLHLVGVRTSFRGSPNGVALFWRALERGLFTDEDRPILDAAERPMGASIARLVSLETALSQSRLDALTGLFNRRAFHEDVGRRIERLRHDREPGCLFFIDLNNFKLVNDVRGHREGDAILNEVAAILRDGTRPSDVAGRIGGDEFVLWLDGADRGAAQDRAAAILAKFRALADRTGDPVRPFGASIGVALYDPALPETIDQISMRADIAMYRAKRQKTGFAIAEAAETTP
jgi:diguanylate cyclase (GGDEF)-like protein/PAS domain S-box-containing protein